MDLNAIQLFVQVVEAKSFSAAARVTKVPKSTIARRIDELEADLGVRLLQRTSRQSELTEAGAAFYARSQHIVREVEDAVAAASAHQATPRGKLRFTASVLLGERYAGRWASEYMLENPEVELDMYLSPRNVDMVADGFDLALRVGEPSSSSLIMRRLATVPSYVCASPAYLERHGTPSTPEDLLEHDCVFFSAAREKAPWSLSDDARTVELDVKRRRDTSQRLDVTRPEAEVKVDVKGRLVVNSLPIAKDACALGLGLAQLPALVCCEELNDGRLVRVLPEWANTRNTLHALYPSRAHLLPVVRTFLDFLVERLDPPPWDLERPTS